MSFAASGQVEPCFLTCKEWCCLTCHSTEAKQRNVGGTLGVWGTGLWNLEEAGPPGVSLGHPAHLRDLYSKGSNEVGMSLDSESSSHLLYEPSSQGSILPTELYLRCSRCQ